MIRLRLWFTILVTVVTLPWGAWLGAGMVGVSLATDPAAALAQAIGALPAPGEAVGGDERLEDTPRQCASARLPGSPCGSLLAVLPPGPALPEPPEATAFAQAHVLIPTGHVPEGPTDPPRFC